MDSQTTNGPSLFIFNITGNATGNPTIINSPSHNLQTGNVIQIQGIASVDPFVSLNGGIFGVVRINTDDFQIWKYSASTGQFSDVQTNPVGTFIGKGTIRILDNFSIVSKKFNFLEDGQNIQLGYIDILLDNTDAGAISLNVYLDYNDSNPINTYPENVIPGTTSPDTFFNTIVPTTVPLARGSSKNWQRVFCPTRGAFLTIEWTLSNAQMVGPEQASNVKIDSQILWIRKAGRQLPIGI